MSWEKNRPVGSQPFKLGDDAIRENFAYIEDTLGQNMEFGPSSDHTGRPKAPVAGMPGALGATPKSGYYAFNPTVPALHYYDGTDQLTIFGIPKGTIIEWSGSVNDVPPGWRMCCPYHAVLAPMGASGVGTAIVVNGVPVPDLGGVWTVGVNPNDPDYDTAGTMGGSPEHVVEEENIEQFSPTPTSAWSGGGTTPIAGGALGSAVTSATHTQILIGQVLATPIDHRPPYYVVCKLILVGV